ncbi:MAG: metal ABC transporter ATP-binding protein [Candidatus Aminicenantes bacterium]|nr:metal ABC transporter ATP-binding protein [Candidatus Aminicenantes bacterium]
MHTGDFLAVIGPNGSGKTTLIKIILGLLEPDQGRVKILGRSLGGFSEWSKLGYVPQNATHVDPFFPVSVKEVVDMGLIKEARSKQAGKEKGMEAISWALKQVDMEDQQNHRIGNLSGGQQQRVFIARAIVNKPVILFLDEPTTGVDAETQDRFYEMLGVLNKKEKMTIVLVTHDIGIVNKHVNRVACLNQKLIYHGDHDEFCRSEAFKSMLEGGHHLVSHRH